MTASPGTRAPGHPPGLAYRPDIDGLRAIAVAAVVAFHAFPDLVPGGFVGVDVFFVISGYLITGLIFSRLAAGRFSFADFYARRIRRIFPALALVLAACYAAGWISLVADEFATLGEHVAGGAGFVANFVLWAESGYFDLDSDRKPLLHLWSLGVEEQFYLAWPLLLFLAWQVRAWLGQVILLVGVASLVAGLWLLADDPAGRFYSPVGRLWELSLGALLCHANSAAPAPGSGRVRGLAAWCGLALVLAATFFLDGQLAYPGYWALIPTLGTALVVWAGSDTWLNRRVLASTSLVGVGLISYPLYLWHWPLLSFGRILGAGTPAATTRLAAIVAAVLMAWATYALVERPIRQGRAGRAAVPALCVVMALLVAAGLVTSGTGGLPFRRVNELNPVLATAVMGADHRHVAERCGLAGDEQRLVQFCFEDEREPPRFATWGDSHAQALFWGLVAESGAGRRWRNVGNPACAPMIGVHPAYADRNAPYWRTCAAGNREILARLTADASIEAVVLVVSGKVLTGIGYVGEPSDVVDPGAAVLGLANATRALQAAGKRVLFVIDHPTFPAPRDCIAGRRLGLPFAVRTGSLEIRAGCAVPLAEHLEQAADYRVLVTRLAEAAPGLVIYDTLAVLCDKSSGICPVLEDGRFLYSDDDHLSDAASALIARDLLPWLDR